MTSSKPTLLKEDFVKGYIGGIFTAFILVVIGMVMF